MGHKLILPILKFKSMMSFCGNVRSKKCHLSSRKKKGFILLCKIYILRPVSLSWFCPKIPPELVKMNFKVAPNYEGFQNLKEFLLPSMIFNVFILNFLLSLTLDQQVGLLRARHFFRHQEHVISYFYIICVILFFKLISFCHYILP